MARHFSTRELDLLRVLREAFLSFEERSEENAAPADPYWYSAEELALYERTFAQRIGWKWDAVLDELRRRGRMPMGRTVLDWGCGSGIATSRFLGAGAAAGVERVFVWDHSMAAMEFASARLAAEFPALAIERDLPREPVDVLLVSHVLDELSAEALEPLLELARGARAVLWVEPGSRRPSRRLGAVRERLSATLDVLAPCTHQAACGALAVATNWCHLFARPPRQVYTEGQWTEFGRELGIDLRSLAYSFLVLAQRGTFELTGPAARLLGRPRLTRGKAEFDLCDASGVARVDFLQRTDKALYKQLDDVTGEPWLVDATLEGRRVAALTRRDA